MSRNRPPHGSIFPLRNSLGLVWVAAVLGGLLAKPGANAQVREVVVVFKTHFDIGYTDLVTNVLTRYRTTFLDGALKLIDDSQKLDPDRRFVWTVPGWPLEQMLWPGQTEERREKTLAALKAGRLAVHALPFTLQTESLDLEDLVRGLTFSAELARTNGLPLPRAGKMTDVPEHIWVVPTVLTHAGITFLHLGCNGGSTPMHVPPLFWWEGPDGSRLLTFYSPEYGTGVIPPKDWPYHTWLAMIMTGDNHGPPKAAEVEKLLDQAKRELPGVRIKFGRLEDFHDALVAEKNPNIPVVRGDMPDTWIHGFESMPRATKLAWDVRPLEEAVSLLDTELRAAGLNPPALKAQLARAYENSLLYSEHTFGYHGNQPGGFFYGEQWRQKLAEGKYARFLKSFEDKKDYIRTTGRIVTNALNERLLVLAKNVRTDGPRITVFNPLPWTRSGEVKVPTVASDWKAVRDLSSGRVSKLSRGAARTARFFASDVPAGGYKTFRRVLMPATEPKRSADAGSATVIQNKFFRLKVDPRRGCISSLTDLKSGRELVAPKDEFGFGQYLHERFSSNQVYAFVRSYCRGNTWVTNDFGKPGMPGPDQAPYARVTLTNSTASVQADTFAKILTLRCTDAAPLAKAVTMKFTLYEDQPYLDVEWDVQDKTPNPLPEGGWICLPFGIEHPTFKLARLGSVVDPAKDIIEGANRHMFCLNSGMTVTGPDGFGVGLCPVDSPLVSLDEPGLWKFSLDYVPRKARVLINLYNNQWDTNFPLWQEGSWSSRVRAWVVRGGKPAENLLEPSWDARAPLQAAYAEGTGGKLPVSQAGLQVSREGTLATCLGPDPYSEHVLLRVWELAGESGPLTVKLPQGIGAARAVPVNLRGEPDGQPIGIKKDSFRFRLPAFAPASFVLEGQ